MMIQHHAPVKICSQETMSQNSAHKIYMNLKHPFRVLFKVWWNGDLRVQNRATIGVWRLTYAYSFPSDKSIIKSFLGDDKQQTPTSTIASTGHASWQKPQYIHFVMSISYRVVLLLPSALVSASIVMAYKRISTIR